MTERAVTVLITSAGRRNYLVRWFREALESVSPRSRVVVADASPDAPARAEASAFERLPSIRDEAYLPTLLQICDRYEVDVALSLNDYELSHWARTEMLATPSTQFLRLSERTQAIVEDKFELASHLDAHGLRYPPTVTAASYLSGRDTLPGASRLVIKARYGSGSSGLVITDADRAEQAISGALPHAHDRTGSPLGSPAVAAEALVVQPFIAGQEHGLDVVNDLGARYQAVLARTKLAMRGGETDRAETTDASPFRETGARLSRALGHRGLVDTDVIVDGGDQPWVIDVNPRFGGGYPFSHVAGANVPLAMVRWLTGRHHEDALEYRSGCRGAKYIEVAGIPSDE
ncbi:ATP-grasp domain-containing protein [Georgenia phoenicis]|uniref:ATP-grasp domain-containing protein n=1 Tax=unclassified Georgenia TaxID=2626815 RepID=UPI0039B09500